MAIKRNSEILAGDIRKELRRNYLRSILSTTTVSGVTCTNNNDGTYTVGGKATSDVWLTLGSLYLPKGVYRLVGNKANSGTHLKLHTSDWSSQCADLGSGANIETNGDTYELSIYVSSGTSVVSNTLIKPMITNDLSATYDDFVSYNDSFVTGINSGINVDLLWENASPTSSFGPQTLTFGVNLETYNYVCIVCKYLNTADIKEVNFIKPDANYYTLHVSRSESYWRYQTRCYSNRVDFGDGLVDGTTNQNACIPLQIFGVK